MERINGRLEDEFGGRNVRVRGPAKVQCHLLFGLLALTVDQLPRLALRALRQASRIALRGMGCRGRCVRRKDAAPSRKHHLGK